MRRSCAVSSTRWRDLRRRHALAEQRKADILPHIHMRIEREQLEHEGDVALGGALEGHVLAAEEDPAGGRQLEPGDHPSVVVLPQPDGPSRQKNEPSGMVKLESFTATKSPKLFAGFRPGSQPSAYSGNFETTMNITVPTSIVGERPGIERHRERLQQHQDAERRSPRSRGSPTGRAGSRRDERLA